MFRLSFNFVTGTLLLLVGIFESLWVTSTISGFKVFQPGFAIYNLIILSFVYLFPVLTSLSFGVLMLFLKKTSWRPGVRGKRLILLYLVLNILIFWMLVGAEDDPGGFAVLLIVFPWGVFSAGLLVWSAARLVEAIYPRRT